MPLLSRRRFIAAGLAAVPVVVLGAQAWLRPAFAGPRLTAREAHAQAVSGAITLIDIRRPDEWQRTGIGQAAHPIDMRQATFETDVAALLANRDAPVALICAAGVRSARMSARLAAAGFTHVIDVPEGMTGSSAGPGWIAAGLPIVPYE